MPESDSLAPLDYGDSPDGIEDVEIISHGGAFSAGVSFDADDEGRKNVLASVFARQFGLRSVDYTRRTYVEPHYDKRPARPDWLQDAIDITTDAKSLVYSAARRAYALRNKPDHVGIFAAGAALLRLPVTFRAATLTIRNGFHFESASLIRLILEQLAWALSVRECTDKAFFEVDPHRCIGHLNRTIAGAGRLYGKLSQAAHIVPALTLRYLDFSVPGDPAVKLLTFERVVDDALALLIAADAYCVTSEIVYHQLLPSLSHVILDSDGSPRAAPSRPGVDLFAHWRDADHVSSPDGA